MSQNAVLTWADVLKLCVPFAFALVLMWAKLAYENRSERKAKQTSLWRTLIDGQGGLTKIVITIGRIATAPNSNQTVLISFDLPETLNEFANRLAELDTNNAHIYISYSAQLQIVRTGAEYLKELNAAFIESSTGEPRDRIVKAMAGQARYLRKNLLALARRELDVLEAMRRCNSRFDRQAIDNQKKLIEDVSSEIEKQKV